MAGLLAVSVASDTIAVRLDGIRSALARVGTGDLSQDLLVDDGGEVGQLQAGFNQMVHGLRERQQLQDLFLYFVTGRSVIPSNFAEVYGDLVVLCSTAGGLRMEKGEGLRKG